MMNLMNVRKKFAAVAAVMCLCTALLNAATVQGGKAKNIGIEKRDLLVRDVRQSAGKIVREARAKNATKHKALQKKRSLQASGATRAASSNEITGCCECITILASDFGDNLDTTYVIAAPASMC